MLSDIHNKIQIKHYLHYNRSIEPNELDLPINTFYKRLYGNRYNIYDIIPENKKREEIEHLDTLSHAIPDVSDSMIQSYNDNVVGIFRKIEQNGLWTEKGFEYTKYNLFTTTGRPANSNNGINYAALNKDDGTSSKYISRHPGGIIAEFGMGVMKQASTVTGFQISAYDTSSAAFSGTFSLYGMKDY